MCIITSLLLPKASATSTDTSTEYQKALQAAGLVGRPRNISATLKHWEVSIEAVEERWHRFVRHNDEKSSGSDIFQKIESELQRVGSAGCPKVLSKANSATRIAQMGSTLTSTLQTIIEMHRGPQNISMQKPLRIAHVISPVFARKSATYLDEITMITLASMSAAHDFTHKYSNGLIEVELWLTNFEDEPKPKIKRYRYTRPVNRSVIELAAAAHIKLPLTKTNPKPRRLPVANDILEAVHESTSADYIIYSNTDIGIMPYFYTFVALWFAAGLDSMYINRVPLPIEGHKYPDLPSIWSEVLKHPQKHGGWDCFGWHRSLFGRFRWRLGVAVVGAPPIGTKLKKAIMCYAQYFLPVLGKHLTFHLGGTGSGDTHRVSGWGFGRPWNFNYHKHYHSLVKPEPCSGDPGSSQKLIFHGLSFNEDEKFQDQVAALCSAYKPNEPLSIEFRLLVLYSMVASEEFLP